MHTLQKGPPYTSSHFNCRLTFSTFLASHQLVYSLSDRNLIFKFVFWIFYLKVIFSNVICDFIRQPLCCWFGLLSLPPCWEHGIPQSCYTICTSIYIIEGGHCHLRNRSGSRIPHPWMAVFSLLVFSLKYLWIGYARYLPARNGQTELWRHQTYLIRLNYFRAEYKLCVSSNKTHCCQTWNSSDHNLF